MDTKQLDPRIGRFLDGRYYAFVKGYYKPETVGMLAEIEAALGIADAAATPAPSAPSAPSAKPAKLPRRAYVVSVKIAAPGVTNSWVVGEYDFEVDARTRAEAIKAAREDYRNREGREAIAPTFRARLAD